MFASHWYNSGKYYYRLPTTVSDTLFKLFKCTSSQRRRYIHHILQLIRVWIAAEYLSLVSAFLLLIRLRIWAAAGCSSCRCLGFISLVFAVGWWIAGWTVSRIGVKTYLMCTKEQDFAENTRQRYPIIIFYYKELFRTLARYFVANKKKAKMMK